MPSSGADVCRCFPQLHLNRVTHPVSPPLFSVVMGHGGQVFSRADISSALDPTLTLRKIYSFLTPYMYIFVKLSMSVCVYRHFLCAGAEKSALNGTFDESRMTWPSYSEVSGSLMAALLP